MIYHINQQSLADVPNTLSGLLPIAAALIESVVYLLVRSSHERRLIDRNQLTHVSRSIVYMRFWL